MRVLFHQHLFDENPKEYTVDGETWGEIVQKIGIKGHLAIYDWGTRLEYPACHDLKPKGKTARIIRLPKNKTAKIIVGAALTVAGVALAFVPGAGIVGASLIISGLAVFASSFIKIPEQKDMSQYKDGYSIYGGNNPNAIGRTPPVVIGEHKVLPPIVGTNVSRIQDGPRHTARPSSHIGQFLGIYYDDLGGFDSTQYIKFLYCLGYRSDDTLVKDIKIDGNLFCSNKEGVRNGALVIDGNFGGRAEIRQDGFLPSLYTTSTKETNVNSEVKTYSEEYAKGFYTTQPRTVGIGFSIYISGFFYTKDDGGITWTQTGFTVLYRAAGATDWKTLDKQAFSGNQNKLWRKSFQYDIPEEDLANNPSGIWEVLVARTGGGDSTRHSNKMIVGYFQSITKEPPVTGKLSKKLVYLCCEFQATEANIQSIQNLTAVVQNAIPIWDGNNWDTKAFTSNPAAWYRWVMKSPCLPRQAADSRFAMIDIETLYNWCEDEGRTCNAVVSSPVQVRDLLNDILSTCQATFYLKNGLYSYSHDKSRPNPVALLTPKNSSDFTIQKDFSEPIDAIEVSFNDKESDYEQVSEVILPYGATDYSNSSKMDLFGTTNYAQATKIARYLLACNKQRAETYTLTLGIEHFSIPRGERVIIQQDVLNVGVASGRIESIGTDGTHGVITIDETVSGQGTGQFAIKIFREDGVIQTIPVISQEQTSNQLLVSLEENDLSEIREGDLYAYGPSGMEVLDCVVKDKAPIDNYKCELTLIPYDESIFEATDKPVPAYNPKIFGGTGGLSWTPPSDLTPPTLETIQTPHQGNIFYDFAAYSYDANGYFFNRGTLRELSKVERAFNIFDYSEETTSRGILTCWAKPNSNMTEPVSFFVDNVFWKSTTISFMSKGFNITTAKSVLMSYNDQESKNHFSVYCENGKVFVESQGVAIDASAIDWQNAHHIVITRNWDTFVINIYQDATLVVSERFAVSQGLLGTEDGTAVFGTEDGKSIIADENSPLLRSALNRNILFYLFGDDTGLGFTDCNIGDFHIFDWELEQEDIENLYTNGILLLSVDKLSRYLGEFMGIPPLARLGDSFKWVNTTTDTFQNGQIYWLTPSGWALLKGNAEAGTLGQGA